MKIKPDALRLGGYRLPTEAEWEYVCRAGAESSRPFGASLDLLGRYACYITTSQDHAWPCGSLLPNEIGLFDLLGNVCEWCQDAFVKNRPDPMGTVTDETTVLSLLNETNQRIIRGGTFDSRVGEVRSAYRGWIAPSVGNCTFGLRPARTLP